MPVKLIAFDLDGVLVEDPGSWTAVHEGLGTQQLAKQHEQEFYKGLIDYDEWARRDALLWNGASIYRIEEILNAVPLMNGIHEAIPKLKEKYFLVILSGGLQMLADRVKNLFHMDYVVANQLLVENGLVKGIRQSMAFNDKGMILRDTAMKFNVKASECAAVGDFLNDVPMFEAAGVSIAFNPKQPEVVQKASYVIREKNLAKLLDIL
jgi:phosphoserine phosphatase